MTANKSGRITQLLLFSTDVQFVTPQRKLKAILNDVNQPWIFFGGKTQTVHGCGGKDHVSPLLIIFNGSRTKAAVTVNVKMNHAKILAQGWEFPKCAVHVIFQHTHASDQYGLCALHVYHVTMLNGVSHGDSDNAKQTEMSIYSGLQNEALTSIFMFGVRMFM